jgi:hypothetical protein
VRGEEIVADGVDAAVDRVEAACLDAVPDSACGQTSQLQLTKGDHPVLSFRDRRDAYIARGFMTFRPV